MQNRRLFVEEYEEDIPLFLANNKIGTVHSIFSNGMNVRMGERLFFVGTMKIGSLPFGIHLQNDVVHELMRFNHSSSPVIWIEKTKELFFENTNVFINLESGIPYSNKLTEHKQPVELNTDHLPTIIATLVENGEKTGLDIDIGQFVLDYLSEEKNVPESETEQKVNDLLKAIFSEDEKEIEKVIRYFLGRGKGLTPSGDDHFVGLLAIDQIFQVFSTTFLQILTNIIEQESVTTDIGKEYLLYALKGKFSSNIVNLINHLQEKDDQLKLKKYLQQIVTMGHSSGVDTAFGLVIGLLAVRERQLTKKD